MHTQTHTPLSSERKRKSGPAGKTRWEWWSGRSLCKIFPKSRNESFQWPGKSKGLGSVPGTSVWLKSELRDLGVGSRGGGLVSPGKCWD